MEKLAEGLQKLVEDDLLQVVQMIHDNKTETTYVKNDVERKLIHIAPLSHSASSLYASWFHFCFYPYIRFRHYTFHPCAYIVYLPGNQSYSTLNIYSQIPW